MSYLRFQTEGVLHKRGCRQQRVERRKSEEAVVGDNVPPFCLSVLCRYLVASAKCCVTKRASSSFENWGANEGVGW